MFLFGIDYILGGVLLLAILKYAYWLLVWKFQIKWYFIDLLMDYIFVLIFLALQSVNIQFKMSQYVVITLLLILELLILPGMYFLVKKIVFKKLSLNILKYYPFVDIAIFILSFLFTKLLFSALYVL